MMWDSVKSRSPRSHGSLAEALVPGQEAAVFPHPFPALEDKGNVSNTPISCTIRELRAHRQRTDQGLCQRAASLLQDPQVCSKTWPLVRQGDREEPPDQPRFAQSASKDRKGSLQHSIHYRLF